MTQEQLFASFVLDRDQGLEIALPAADVMEATAIPGKIQPLPASADFLEGIVTLREDLIPVINLKKRLGLSESSYKEGSKIAVVRLSGQRLGLLFDDIKEVLRIDESALVPINPALQSEDKIISDLIKIDQGQRSIELLDLQHLFPGGVKTFGEAFGSAKEFNQGATVDRVYSRYVVFTCAGQEYGILVEHSQEITFPSDVDTMFKNGCVDGALQLRGSTIPVVNASFLLSKRNGECRETEENRIMVLNCRGLTFGINVEKVREIIPIAKEEILPMPCGNDDSVVGLFQDSGQRNIMLLDIGSLIAPHFGRLKSMERLDEGGHHEDQSAGQETSRHLITENCYLVFAAERKFAVELKDVQELIEGANLMDMPAADGFNGQVINLRGQVVPVVDLRIFLGFQPRKGHGTGGKLIICRNKEHIVALKVDNIVTIYKQEKYYETPTLNPQLSKRKDTLDRLIEFLNYQGMKEHVLVLNIHNLVTHHLFPDEEGKARQEQEFELHVKVEGR